MTHAAVRATVALICVRTLNLALGGAAAQPPTGHHWTRLGTNANQTAWMDTTHVTTEPSGVRIAWYRVQAPHEKKFTVVEYAVDCPTFTLATRHIITYDGAGGIVVEDRVHRSFRSPPFVESVQRFMHVVCHQPIGP